MHASRNHTHAIGHAIPHPAACATAQAGCVVHSRACRTRSSYDTQRQENICASYSMYMRSPYAAPRKNGHSFHMPLLSLASLWFMELPRKTGSLLHPSDHLQGPQLSAAAGQHHFWSVCSSLSGLQLTFGVSLGTEADCRSWVGTRTGPAAPARSPKKSADKHTRSKIKSSSASCSTHKQAQIDARPHACTRWPPCEPHKAMHAKPHVSGVVWFRLPCRTPASLRNCPFGVLHVAPPHLPRHPGCGVPHLIAFGKSFCCKRGAAGLWFARPGKTPWGRKPSVVADGQLFRPSRWRKTIGNWGGGRTRLFPPSRQRAAATEDGARAGGCRSDRGGASAEIDWPPKGPGQCEPPACQFANPASQVKSPAQVLAAPGLLVERPARLPV